MIYIREAIGKEQIESIVKLHIKAFRGFFLTQLGKPFLHTLYKGYLEDLESGIIIAEDQVKVIGFIAYSRDYSRFYKNLIKTHLLKFAMCSVVATFRHPSFAMRLLRAFKKSKSVKREEKYVELASICVDPDIKGNGVGSRLIEALKRAVDFSTYSYINLETDAENNDDVNLFYKKNGFQLIRSYITLEGRQMNEYRYKPEE